MPPVSREVEGDAVEEVSLVVSLSDPPKDLPIPGIVGVGLIGAVSVALKTFSSFLLSTIGVVSRCDIFNSLLKVSDAPIGVTGVLYSL